MIRIEKLVFSLIIGGVFPLFFLLLSTTLWFYFFRQTTSPYLFSIPALAVALTLYIKFIQIWKMKIYRLPIWFLICTYTLFNIGMFGLFMGFPVFNLFWGIVAGYYFGKRIKQHKFITKVQDNQKERVAIFTSSIMFIICIATGLIVFVDKYIGSDIQNMFDIETNISRPLISGITILGGILLTVAQYFVTLITLNRIISKND